MGDGKLLATLSEAGSGGGLVVCADPAATPQLLAGSELDEAREIFVRSGNLLNKAQKPSKSSDDPKPAELVRVGPDDFLMKPVHVALEERSHGMEDLADFNEAMRKTEEAAKAPADVATASDQLSSAVEAAAKEDAPS